MASTSSISGLASGLDTSSLVTQLMQIEAQPQTLLKTRLSATQTTAAAYRSLNTRFNALQAAADALTSSGLAAAKTATSTDSSVAASATSSAVAGNRITFAVSKTAATETQLSESTWSLTDDVTSQEPAWPIQVIQDGKPIRSITLQDGHTSLLDAVVAINASGYGLQAQLVQVGKDQYKLQVTSQTSGSEGIFGLASSGGTTADGSFVPTTAGQDAVLDLGLGKVAVSSTNTFANLLPGVSVTVSKADDAKKISVSVGSDPSSLATKVQAMVDAANATLSEIDKDTAVTAKTSGTTTTTSGGVLSGDFTVNQLSGRVLNAVSDVIGKDASAVAIGLQTTRDGQLTFDKDKFLAAYATDPDKVAGMLAGTPASTTTSTVAGVTTTTTTPAVTGLAQRMSDLAKAASNTTTGTLTLLAQGQDTRAKDLQDQIDDWDTRLATRQATLTAQFTAMETALSTLKNQSSWLSGQLASLSNSSSN